MLNEEKKAEFTELGRQLRDGIIHSNRMSHTSVVVTAAGVLDKALEQAIKTKLPSLDDALAKRMFGDFGPLNSFAAKIDMAQALDITSKSIYRELGKIKKIRNKFSHSDKILSLDVEPMKTLFMGLQRPPNASGSYAEQFMACIVVIDEFLEAYMVRAGLEREVYRQG
jgi:hypothetical protein